jgi:hypothetical protein
VAARWQRTLALGAEAVFEHPPTRLLALRLPERARVEPRPDGRAMTGDLRRLDRVDAAATGERAEAATEVVRGCPLKPRGRGRLLNGAGDIAERERLAARVANTRSASWPRPAASSALDAL